MYDKDSVKYKSKVLIYLREKNPLKIVHAQQYYILFYFCIISIYFKPLDFE